MFTKWFAGGFIGNVVWRGLKGKPKGGNNMKVVDMHLKGDIKQLMIRFIKGWRG